MSSPTPAAPPPAQLSEIGQIAFIVGDMAKMTAFYRDVLGVKFLFDAGPTMTFFAAGSVRLMLATPQGAGEVGKNSILYFKVRDIAGTHAALVARGATSAAEPRMIAQMPDHELWLAAVRDPEGNIVELMEEKR